MSLLFGCPEFVKITFRTRFRDIEEFFLGYSCGGSQHFPW
jgi:hypothetical protein